MNTSPLRLFKELLPLQKELAKLIREHRSLHINTISFTKTLAHTLSRAAQQPEKITAVPKAAVIFIPQQQALKVFNSLNSLKQQHIVASNIIAALNNEFRSHGNAKNKTLASAKILLKDISTTLHNSYEQLQHIGNKHAPPAFIKLLRQIYADLQCSLSYSSIDFNILAVPHNRILSFSGVVGFDKLRDDNGYIWDKYWLIINKSAEGYTVTNSSELFPPLQTNPLLLSSTKLIWPVINEHLADDNITRKILNKVSLSK